ncbi:Uncharacterized protein GBIM_02521 [Gryllus bimaculatus]|nr:Uncharacterized protein GBIM_02521 [Gryllus bimaculatus]
MDFVLAIRRGNFIVCKISTIRDSDRRVQRRVQRVPQLRVEAGDIRRVLEGRCSDRPRLHGAELGVAGGSDAKATATAAGHGNSGGEIDAFYTLIMVDPDAPGMLRGEYWLHWIVVNIKGSHFQIGNLDDATEVAKKG